ncbi:MAG: YcxB family protein [Butyrivibrio sp.]|uniref:YcxB family protein n=1 Tax=Butyrivibrio sp. TaxID=28121 RepID=UPI001B5342B3|nr:YcxB family protein [Butyrivibrio sp.]MBP3782712.1 YcxB family protein [Butyrivibrio sp.]
MEYKYMCDVKASDLWKMAMVRTYKAAIGVVNIVFTVAMILLVFRFWKTAPDILRVLMIFGCLVFPVIQPLATYGMCVKQLENMPRDMELKFDDVGVHVSTGGQSELIRWNKVKNAIKRNNMIVVMSDDSHGYMLTNRVLGNEKEEFYNFLCSKIRG